MLLILFYITNYRGVNRKFLADTLGCTRRTISRDLDIIRELPGFSIEYSYEDDGYYLDVDKSKIELIEPLKLRKTI